MSCHLNGLSGAFDAVPSIYFGQPIKGFEHPQPEGHRQYHHPALQRDTSGSGKKAAGGSRRKGGIKVHTMMDAFSGETEFVRRTEARVHDRKFLYLLKLEPDADILRTDGPAADGGDPEKVGHEEVVRQHDPRDQTVPDELCEPYGVHQGHLQGVAKDV